MKIVLVAGHNMKNYGAIRDHIREWNLANDIINKFYRKSFKNIDLRFLAGLHLSLQDKIDQINEMNPDLAIELHFNACADENVKGSEAFFMDGIVPSYFAENKDLRFASSALLAEVYCDIMQETTGIVTRGAKADNLSQYNRLAWCRDLKCRSILVENEFLTYRDFDVRFVQNCGYVAMYRFLKELAG